MTCHRCATPKKCAVHGCCPGTWPGEGEEPDDGAHEAQCPECEGYGRDKWNDYCLPCPMCGGDGRLW